MLVVVLLLIVFVVPFLLGNLLAKFLRQEDLATRIGVVLLAIFASLAPFAWVMYLGQSWKNAIPLGIDLAGGTNLVYGIDNEAA